MTKPSRVDTGTVVRRGKTRDVPLETQARRGPWQEAIHGLVGPWLAGSWLAGGAALTILATALPARAMFVPAAEGETLAVATDNGNATLAALATLAAGGNAVDAA